jgi:calmodulin
MEQTSESVLTEERVNEFREAFAIFDKDNDGVISFQELGELMKLLGQTLKDGEINEIQENVDLEKKGVIDFKDFLAFMVRKITDSNQEPNLIDGFKIFDRNKDGLIDSHELFEVLTSLGIEVKEDEVDEMVKESDMDGDGYINYDEFVKLIMK